MKRIALLVLVNLSIPAFGMGCPDVPNYAWRTLSEKRQCLHYERILQKALINYIKTQKSDPDCDIGSLVMLNVGMTNETHFGLYTFGQDEKGEIIAAMNCGYDPTVLTEAIYSTKTKKIRIE